MSSLGSNEATIYGKHSLSIGGLMLIYALNQEDSVCELLS